MALRNILTKGDPTLNKTSRPIKDYDRRLRQLLDDMRDTLLEANGVGLAAPQVGILRRAVLVLETNVDEEAGEEPYIIELLNPEIVFAEGEQTGPEGCLSVPDVFGLVTRPDHVRVRAFDRDGNVFERDGYGLTARAFCHEIEHLDGHLFLEKADHIMSDEEIDRYYAEQREEKDGAKD